MGHYDKEKLEWLKIHDPYNPKIQMYENRLERIKQDKKKLENGWFDRISWQ